VTLLFGVLLKYVMGGLACFCVLRWGPEIKNEGGYGEQANQIKLQGLWDKQSTLRAIVRILGAVVGRERGKRVSVLCTCEKKKRSGSVHKKRFVLHLFSCTIAFLIRRLTLHQEPAL